MQARRPAGLLAVVVGLAIARAVFAQTCLGFPSVATGPVNISASISIGTEWWGIAGQANVAPQRAGFFGGGAAGTVRFVDDPVESRFSWGVLGGFDWISRGQLHACPFVTAGFDNGDYVTRSNGERTRIHVRVLGVGVAFAGEQQSRRFRSFSVAPYVSARLTQIVTVEDVANGARRENDETGIHVVGGLGFRLRDAIQITPSFATSTFENADLVFTLRLSVALERRR